MRYELGVLRDYVTELRIAQSIVNTKPELDIDDMDLLAECLNRGEILVMSIIGSLVETGSAGYSQEVREDVLAPEDLAEKLKQGLMEYQFEVVMPDDVPEEEKYSSEDEPVKKS